MSVSTTGGAGPKATFCPTRADVRRSAAGGARTRNSALRFAPAAGVDAVTARLCWKERRSWIECVKRLCSRSNLPAASHRPSQQSQRRIPLSPVGPALPQNASRQP